MLPYQRYQKIRAPKNQNSQHQTSQSSHSLDMLHGVPFWIWERELHLQKAIESKSQCCFNHIVGCPTKGGRECPLWDYEKIMFDTLMDSPSSSAATANARRPAPMSVDFKDKHLWILKSTGIGASEFFLRLMAWLAVRNNDYRNSQMVIVTGPNLDLAIKLIKRMKAIFEPKLNIIFDNKETVIELNDCTIEAYPSNHLDSFRALTNPKFILLDEADFFRKSDQQDVRHVSERYIGKSNPFIVMLSSPNAPLGLMEKIQKEPEANLHIQKIIPFIRLRLRQNLYKGRDSKGKG